VYFTTGPPFNLPQDHASEIYQVVLMVEAVVHGGLIVLHALTTSTLSFLFLFFSLFVYIFYIK